MAFWQSPEWMSRVDSIYELDPAKGNPTFMPWWKEAWQLFQRQKNYDIILTMGVRESFAFAALCRLFRRKPCHIMTEVFIDSPQTNRISWQLKTAWYRILVRQVAGIITNSRAEIQTNAARFGISADRFRFVPLNTTIAEPVYDPRPDGYLFCGGRTLRDYPTLVNVILNTDQPWKIVAGTEDLLNIDLPPRVTVDREINRSRYLELLQGARIVILPLLPTERATGQVVLLEAMSYGKPVITTRAPGTVDIIRNKVNGYLVEPRDADAIRQLLDQLLQDSEACSRIGKQALQDVLDHYTTKIHTELRLAAIQSIWTTQDLDR